ncbi:MAG: hypothetical protein R2844_03285 [Caldilineales bacterium]
METPFLVFIMLPFVIGGALLVGLFLLARIMPGTGKAGKADAAAVQPVPARGPEYVKLRARRAAAYRLGLVVFMGLVVLSVIEFVLAHVGSTALMFIMIVFKAALVMYFFMHIASVWRTEEAH